MTGTTLIAVLPQKLVDMLDNTAEKMMVKRTAVVRLAVKKFCEGQENEKLN